MKSLKINFTQLMLLAIVFLAASCGKDDDAPSGSGTDDPISSFQFEISDTDWRVVDFSNFSSNADSFEWDFGDSNTSTEESPTHTYDAGGTYDVTLTATGGGNSRTSTKTLTISDPNEAIKDLTGDVSKTWKLFREGISMSLGPDADNPAQWWSGLANDGSRPCAYEQEFTFHIDGGYTFNDAGQFWAEFGVFNNVEGCTENTNESCLDAVAANMVNACGQNVSAWLSGSHTFEYDPATSSLTLNGTGAWIGIPKLGTTDALNIVPASSVTTRVTFDKSNTGYDLMLVEFIYAGEYWPITYVNYSDPSLEPPVETDAVVFGEDLDDITPTELSRTFASDDPAEWVLLQAIESGSLVTVGAPDPAGGTELVGQFERVEADFQEFQMQTAPVKNDINFASLTTISLDVYLPSTNDYSTTLTQGLVIGFGDVSATEQWWTALVQYEATDLVLDAWQTVTFDLATPSFASLTDTPFDRADLDMVYIGIGGSGHPVPGTFFIRNFVIN